MKRAFGPAFGVAAALCLVPATSRANPRPLPFSYPFESLPADGFEVEQIVDMTPVKTQDLTGADRTIPRTTLTTEFEYGLTSRLELGFYLQLADQPTVGTDASLRFDGLKQRLRYQLAEPGAWPIDVAVYGEVAELRAEFELEGKVILQKRFGNLRAICNLWAEREFYYAGRREWVLHPTLGAAYEFGPRLALGLESWLVKEIADHDDGPPGADKYNSGPIGYLGPTLFAEGRGRGWISLGAYTRVTDFSRSGQVGDYWGRFWIRVLIGIDL